MAGGFSSPVDLEEDLVGFDFDCGDLNLISQTRGWTRFAQRIFPGGFIVLAVTMNDEWFLGVRQDHLGGSVFGGKTALNFNAFVETEFIGEKTLAEAADE
jgi:hypothetical protein